MKGYEISKKAGQDLENIWFYTLEKWSLDQADHYVSLLIDEIEYLAKNPLGGKDYSEIRKGYWRSKMKSHFIFYRISELEKKIEIIRILHQKMNIEVRLRE